MRVENGLAISLILHFIFLLLLYFNFNVQLFVSVSKIEESSIKNIHNDDFHSNKYSGDKNNEKEEVVLSREMSEKTGAHWFEDQQNNSKSFDQGKTQIIPDELKKFSDSKGEHVLKESSPPNVSLRPLDKKQHIKNKAHSQHSTPSIIKNNIAKLPVPKIDTKQSRSNFSQNEIGIVRRRIMGNWNIPPDLKKFKKIQVKMHFSLNRNGLVIGKPDITVVGGTELARRTLIKSARKAFIKSQPFRLPADKYNNWRNMTIRFIPSKM
ncbi:hypothetical protein C0030_005870 [Candidatus Liberibacter solanacearum]|uniref:TolA protein n=1 Tax=Candidatus Liberibacter solanacearum TaxID=556287 RepID=A0A424FKY8_9HYPH|nr:hypothetical protein [Candidatus Liberibacter solanacearum]RPD36798.1 hypothetical protein C0030_005870 [Candidatus Liberibacter solanacearum]